MEKVVVQTGAKTYQIADQDGNDLGAFRFIPSDAGILKDTKRQRLSLQESMTELKAKILKRSFRSWKRRLEKR